MDDVTLSADKQTLSTVRHITVERNSTVNALVREFLDER